MQNFGFLYMIQALFFHGIVMKSMKTMSCCLKLVFLVFSLSLGYLYLNRICRMCLTPYYIDNPNRHYTKNPFSSLYDSQSQKIAVPCGRCSVCIALKQNYIIQRVQMECLNNFMFYGTWTYNNQTLPSIDVNGYNIKYASIRHFQDSIRYIRKHENLPDFRYMAVTEFGGKNHRPHFHWFLWFDHSIFNKPYEYVTESDLLQYQEYLWPIFLKYWRHNVGTRKNPIWVQNCTYKQVGIKRNYDLQYIDTLSGSCEDVGFYVSKYVTKSSEYVDRLKSALYFNCDNDVFSDVWSLVRPRFLYSKGFGNPSSPDVQKWIIDGINRGINETDFPYPCYYSPTTGQSFPLSPYYRKKFLSFDQELIFKQRCLDLSATGIIGDMDFDEFADVKVRKLEKFKKVKSLIDKRDCSVDIDDFPQDNITDFIYGDIQESVFLPDEFANGW